MSKCPKPRRGKRKSPVQKLSGSAIAAFDQCTAPEAVRYRPRRYTQAELDAAVKEATPEPTPFDEMTYAKQRLDEELAVLEDVEGQLERAKVRVASAKERLAKAAHEVGMAAAAVSPVPTYK